MEVDFERAVVARVEDAAALGASAGTLGPVRSVPLEAIDRAICRSFSGCPLLAQLSASSASTVRIEQVHGRGARHGSGEKPLHGTQPPLAFISFLSATRGSGPAAFVARVLWPKGSPNGLRAVTMLWAMTYWPERVTRAVVLGAAVWIGAVTAIWLFAPVGESTSVSQSSSGQVTTTTSRESLVESDGAGAVVVLGVPVALVGIAVAAQGSSWRRRARYLAGGLLLVGSLLGAMSVGLPYLPAAVALLVAGAKTPARVHH
jgi:hypothetical protein